MTRWRGEVMGLELEAERLVRSGESRAEVSRRLGVHPQTLATWALRGRWRKKDLELERAEEIRRETILTIRDGNRAVDAQNAMRLQLAEAMRECVDLLARGDEASLAKLALMIGALEPIRTLDTPQRVSLGPDPKMGDWKSLGDMEIDREREPALDEYGEAWSPEIQAQHDAEHRARVVRRGERAKQRAVPRDRSGD